MKNKVNSSGFAPIIILILIVLIAGGAYYFGTIKNKSVPAPVISIQPSSSPVAQPTADPTANWKTYRGKVFQYKYPDYLYAVDQNSNDSISLYQNKQVADNSANCLKNHLGTIQNPCAYPLLSIGYSISAQVPKLNNGSGMVNYEVYINPQGLSFTKNSEPIGGQGASSVLEAYITKDSTIYRIDIQTTGLGYWETLYPNDKITNDQISKNENDLLNQILSTFHFLK